MPRGAGIGRKQQTTQKNVCLQLGLAAGHSGPRRCVGAACRASTRPQLLTLRVDNGVKRERPPPMSRKPPVSGGVVRTPCSWGLRTPPGLTTCQGRGPSGTCCGDCQEARAQGSLLLGLGYFWALLHPGKLLGDIFLEPLPPPPQVTCSTSEFREGEGDEQPRRTLPELRQESPLVLQAVPSNLRYVPGRSIVLAAAFGAPPCAASHA